MNLHIRKMLKGDAAVITRAFAEIGWHKPISQYETYHRQQKEGRCIVLVAENNGDFAGYVKVTYSSDYQYFLVNKIPEIQDLNVIPGYRRRGVASKLMDEAERIAFHYSNRVGVGVGLHPGYNAAQRMYVLRGYVPDARGVTWKGEYIREGQPIVADDDLVLHLVKELRR